MISEKQVIDLLQQGLRNREVAEVLFISQATVKVHVQHVLEKLGARTRAEAVARYAEFAEESETKPPESSETDRATPSNANSSDVAKR